MKSKKLSYTNQIKINYVNIGACILLCSFLSLTNDLIMMAVLAAVLYFVSFYMKKRDKESSDEMATCNLLNAKTKARQLTLLLTAIIVILALFADLFKLPVLNFIFSSNVMLSSILFSTFTFYYGLENILTGVIFQRLENA